MSRAHSVVGPMSALDNRLKCIRCGLVGTRKELFGGIACRPHMELESSGWHDESTAEERIWLDNFEKYKFVR